VLLCLALENCGRPDLARELGRKYASLLRDEGLFHIHNAITGKCDRTLTLAGERQLFWSGWTAGSYLYLADRYGGGEIR
jgi:hypothetical protein